MHKRFVADVYYAYLLETLLFHESYQRLHEKGFCSADSQILLVRVGEGGVVAEDAQRKFFVFHKIILAQTATSVKFI